MTHEMKKVTVCIPVFNGSMTIREALDSVLVSADSNRFNVLVVDNASTDNTFNICEEYLKKYPSRIEIRKNSKNLGFAGNYRRCIELATSEYIFFMGADDYFFGKETEKLAKYLDTKSDVALVCSDLIQFYQDPHQPTRKAVHFGGVEKSFSAGDDALSNWLLQSVLGSIGGYLIRTKIAKQYAGTLPAKTIVPQVYLGAMIAGSNDIDHIPCFSFSQRLTDDMSQLANKQYLSLSIVEEIISAIYLVTESDYNNEVKNKVETRQKLLKTYTDGLVMNLVSYRCFATTSIFYQLIKTIWRISPKQVFTLRFCLYFFSSVIVPRKMLNYLLQKYRHRNIEPLV